LLWTRARGFLSRFWCLRWAASSLAAFMRGVDFSAAGVLPSPAVASTPTSREAVYSFVNRLTLVSSRRTNASWWFRRDSLKTRRRAVPDRWIIERQAFGSALFRWFTNYKRETKVVARLRAAGLYVLRPPVLYTVSRCSSFACGADSRLHGHQSAVCPPSLPLSLL
jgi:hypothetical protein